MDEVALRVVKPPLETVDALAAAAAVAELDYAFVRHPPGDEGLGLHRTAVIAGIDHLWQQWQPSVPVDVEAVHGRRVTLREFYGHWFDAETRRGKTSGTSAVIKRMPADEPYPRAVGFDPHHGPFVWLGEEDPEPFYLDPPRDPDEPRGYAAAFFDPVHGKSHRQLWDSFLAVDDVVLGSPGVDTEIYHWAGDWHPYFDDGNEWWGSDAWTVRRDDTTIVVIGASATD